MQSNYLVVKRTGEVVQSHRSYGDIILVKRITKEKISCPRGYFYPSLAMHKRGLTNGVIYDI